MGEMKRTRVSSSLNQKEVMRHEKSQVIAHSRVGNSPIFSSMHAGGFHPQCKCGNQKQCQRAPGVHQPIRRKCCRYNAWQLCH